MLKRSLRTLAISSATFLLGLCLQVLIGQFIGPNNSVIWSLAAILFCLLVVLLFLAMMHEKFDEFDGKLLDIVERTGINMEYLEDGIEGKSYKKSTELVRNAKESLIFVGSWDLFPDYKVDNISLNTGESIIIQARKEFYEAVNEKIRSHQNDDHPFYRRIIQLKEEFMNHRAPFETDPVFFAHLTFVAGLLKSRSTSCTLRKITSSMNIQFTIVDNRYIIMPILTTAKNIPQARYGALIIDDTAQHFVERLNYIYWILDRNANAVDLDQLDLRKL